MNGQVAGNAGVDKVRVRTEHLALQNFKRRDADWSVVHLQGLGPSLHKSIL